MADIEYFEDDSPYRAAAPAGADPSRVGLIVNWAGAIVSLGLVVGMGVWAWQLTMRDVSGVPVIRALEGPMRVSPADPGGAQAEHQGLAVNRIAEGQEAAPGPDRIVLAPPPVELEEIDIASASTPQLAAVAPPLTDANAETQALIDRLIRGAAPLEPTVVEEPSGQAETDVIPTALAPDAAEIRILPVSVPGVRRSPRPQERPVDLRVASIDALVAPEDGAVAGSAEMNADTLPEGTRLVQLGAFDDMDTARSEWARLSSQFPDFFAGRARVLQEATSGGRPFVRLRAHGFDDLSDARRFCTALLAQGAACIPVTVR